MTKKETAKERILTVMNDYSNPVSVKFLSTAVTTSDFSCSVDTIRTAVAELLEESKIESHEDGRKKLFMKVPAPAPTPEPEDVTPQKRGWKSALVRKLFSEASEGEVIDRANLAETLETDEKNTHILIGKLFKGEDTRFTYNREKKAYQF